MIPQKVANEGRRSADELLFGQRAELLPTQRIELRIGRNLQIELALDPVEPAAHLLLSPLLGICNFMPVFFDGSGGG